MTETDIMNIWRESSEEKLVSFDDLKYNWNIPLYQKMIFRFREANKLAIHLYSGCDPNNRAMLLNFFEIDCSCASYYGVMDFFLWIASGLGPYYIEQFGKNCVHSWKKNNIKFFFELSKEQQKILIDKHNKECIDYHNSKF
jgi:hypothetical protein